MFYIFSIYIKGFKKVCTSVPEPIFCVTLHLWFQTVNDPCCRYRNEKKNLLTGFYSCEEICWKECVHIFGYYMYTECDHTTAQWQWAVIFREVNVCPGGLVRTAGPAPAGHYLRPKRPISLRLDACHLSHAAFSWGGQRWWTSSDYWAYRTLSFRPLHQAIHMLCSSFRAVIT